MEDNLQQNSNVEVDNSGSGQESISPVSDASAKEYRLRSGSGLNWFSFTGRVYSNVSVNSERMDFDIAPKRYNKAPTINLSNVQSVEVKVKMAVYWIIYSAVALLGCFAQPALILLVAFFIWAGINWKIIIHQKSGEDAIIYTHSRKDALEFQADIEERIKRMV